MQGGEAAIHSFIDPSPANLPSVAVAPLSPSHRPCDGTAGVCRKPVACETCCCLVTLAVGEFPARRRMLLRRRHAPRLLRVMTGTYNAASLCSGRRVLLTRQSRVWRHLLELCHRRESLVDVAVRPPTFSPEAADVGSRQPISAPQTAPLLRCFVILEILSAVCSSARCLTPLPCELGQVVCHRCRRETMGRLLAAVPPRWFCLQTAVVLPPCTLWHSLEMPSPLRFEVLADSRPAPEAVWLASIIRVVPPQRFLKKLLEAVLTLPQLSHQTATLACHRPRRDLQMRPRCYLAGGNQPAPSVAVLASDPSRIPVTLVSRWFEACSWRRYYMCARTELPTFRVVLLVVLLVAPDGVGISTHYGSGLVAASLPASASA